MFKKTFYILNYLKKNSGDDQISIECCETDGCNKMKNPPENSSGKNKAGFLAILCVLPAVFFF